jgi:hypothetical protein
MAKRKQATKTPPQRRPRRGIEERIAQLEAKIAAVKEREARRQLKADPTMRHVNAALRSIDKAIAATDDSATQRALGTAREALETFLSHGTSGGTILAAPARQRRSPSDLATLGDSLLEYVRSHPGQRGEQIAQALGTDTTTMRPAMKRLIEAGKVRTEGQRRGMTYDPA